MKKGIISLIVALLVYYTTNHLSSKTKWFEGVDLGVLDILFNLRDPDLPRDVNPFVANETLLMGFDIESISAIGKWPWKRYVHGEFLDRIERFSPETVMFDVIFAQPESTPHFVMNQLSGQSNILRQVDQAFSQMDDSFAQALARYNNDYIDLQLIRQARTDDSDEYLTRLAANESVISNYSQQAEGAVLEEMVFRSIEPVLENFITNSHLVAINTQPDQDGVVRTYPLYLTYLMQGSGTLRHVYSVTLQMLKKYYHVTDADIVLATNKVVLKNARMPERDPDNRQRVTRLRPLNDLLENVSNPQAPADYQYNQDLRNFMVNERRLSPASDDQKPYKPLHIVESDRGAIEVIDGWEVLDAAKEIGSTKVDVILHRIRDLEIKTPYPGFAYINYAAKQQKRYVDGLTGEFKIHHPIPTRPYKDVLEGPQVPPLPLVDKDGKPIGTNDWALLDQWFVWLCQTRGFKAMEQAQMALGDDLQNETQIFQWLNENDPDEGRYFFYVYFFQSFDVAPGQFDQIIPQYPFFATEIGQAQKYFLTRAFMISELTDFYQEQFDRYYNRFVFSGGAAEGLADVHQTPYRQMYGINVIINAFNTIVTENQYMWSADIKGLDAMVLIIFCLTFAFLYNLVNFRIKFIVFIAVLFATFAAAWILFAYYSLYFKITPLILSNLEIFLAITVYQLFTEEKDKKFLHATFSQYLAPEVIDQMFANKTMPELGGEEKEITAFFTDIQGFSSFSEKLTASQLVELLNEYLDEMNEIVEAEHGIVDKYIGDAIVAIFGAPMDLPDHGVRACRVAIKMQAKQAELREKWSQEKKNPDEPSRNVKQLAADEWAPDDKWPKLVHDMKTRIGINSDGIVVGNMGSSQRKNYTMMGDGVNLAARLEAGSKQFGVYSMVSENTLEQEFMDDDGTIKKVRDFVEVRFIDSITVVGKTEPVSVYEVCAMKGELTEQEQELFELFNGAMEDYRNQKWDQAIEGFEKALKVERVPDGKMTPSEVFIGRCKKFKKNPPVAEGEEWDGVYRLTSK